MEPLERAFYERGLSQYSEEDFKKADYPDWVRGRFEQIYEHEKIHVQCLESALTAMIMLNLANMSCALFPFAFLARILIPDAFFV
jgi:Ferritin-like domain